MYVARIVVEVLLWRSYYEWNDAEKKGSSVLDDEESVRLAAASRPLKSKTASLALDVNSKRESSYYEIYFSFHMRTSTASILNITTKFQEVEECLYFSVTTWLYHGQSICNKLRRRKYHHYCVLTHLQNTHEPSHMQFASLMAS